MANIAINGIGRIGKLVLQILINQKLNLKHVNELNGNINTLIHSIEFDSIHGKWNADFKLNDKNIIINKNAITTSFSKDIDTLNFKNIDLLIDCTGKNKSSIELNKYFKLGVKKVLVSSPINEDNIANIVYGVNHDIYSASKHKIITAASCTTNCLAPIIKVLHENIGIKHGSISTIHNITNTQTLIDLPKDNLRRARSALNNLIPTTTGSAKAISLIYPELKGKLNGHAIRVPILNSSLTDCVFEMNSNTSVHQINNLFEKASQGSLKGILGYEERPLVSSDYVNDPRSSIIDALSTIVINNTQVKVYAWYDNEWGYANRLVDIAKMISNSME